MCVCVCVLRTASSWVAHYSTLLYVFIILVPNDPLYNIIIFIILNAYIVAVCTMRAYV